ncbi:MAG: type II secretion system F family protein [Planctomycetes bacterium]|nr:type II secretion system F family protein [Planctomycetota bacterium]MCW8136184.1 type II secretion system F family protein [Planctomycetota bacterium]
MPVFEYKALNAKGRAASGVIDAETARDAREKLRHQKIYVTDIKEVRGSMAKREVVKDELGQKKVVVSSELPQIVTYTGTLAIISAGVMLLHLVLRWRSQPEVAVAGEALEAGLTGIDVAVKIASAIAAGLFGWMILKGKTWALFVTAIFAGIEAALPFYNLVTESNYVMGLLALIYGGLAGMCMISIAKMKDTGADEGNDKVQSLREVSAFTRQLATLIHSGIPLAQALTACIEQAESPGMSKTLRHLREQITQGTDFANALETCPGYFNSLYINMVRAGQASGRLDEVLSRIAEYLANQNKLRNKVINAMMYPIIMLTISVLVVAALMTFVVPKITEILIAQKIPLPLPTQILVTISAFMSTYWEILLKGPLVGMFFLQGALQRDSFKLKWDTAKLKMPLVGDLLRKTAVSRFAITFAVLLRSGMPALEALRIVRKIVGNRALQEVIQGVHDSIIEGTDISTPIKKSGVFPPVVGYMIAVGEQTGELEQLLERVAVAYDEEVDISIQRMTGLIEPIMIVFMAVVVGGIVAAVIIPLLQMSTGGMR